MGRRCYSTVHMPGRCQLGYRDWQIWPSRSRAYSAAGKLIRLARWLAEAGTPPPPHLIRFDLDLLAAAFEQLPRKSAMKVAADVQIDDMADVEQIFDQSFAELAEKLLPPPPTSTKRATHPLTRRELEVLCLAAQDMTDREISDALFISVRTAESHMKNVIGKLDVKSRYAAVARAVREGWCD